MEYPYIPAGIKGEMVRSGVDCHWNGQLVGTVGRRPVAIHSSGQTISSLAHIQKITLGAGEEVDEVAGEVAIHTHVTCSSNNIIYLLTFTQCDALYVSETKNSLSTRMNGHHTSSDNPDYLRLPVAIHTKSHIPVGMYMYFITYPQY